MTSQLHRIEISNFKAFRHFALAPEGRHLLVYGANGSGKSSLYWALYTFLQSARKPQGSIGKYFESGDNESLLNFHEQTEATPRPGEIALTFRDLATQTDTTYRINKDNHGTYQQSFIWKGELASDFITYRYFFGFSDFRNSESFNIWPLFEKEILPYCVSTGGKNPLDCWNAIKSANPNPFGDRGIAGRNAYDDFRQKTEEFATILPAIVDSISKKAQEFYDNHFGGDDPAKVTLKLAVTTPPSFTGTDQQTTNFTIPELQFGIQIGGSTIPRPQSFLNEAKLTQLALSVRFAASLVNLHESDLKLLVLDDLLVSLDMSNRMKVVEILLSDTFANYQKVIMTHDLGFFREFDRRLGTDRSNWCCIRLRGNASSSIEWLNEKSDIQKAEEYLNGFQLDEAALCLRKAAESLAKLYREWLEQKSLPPGQFYSLTQNLQAARNRIEADLPKGFYLKMSKTAPKTHRDLVLPTQSLMRKPEAG
jgi:ABC-type Mn2+/Zn2+ transport system ATPase subunit